MTIGERLEQFARERYRTMAAFADELGMSRQQMSNLVNASNGPGAKVLLRLAKKGVNIHWLLTGDGPMDAPSPGNTTVAEVTNVESRVEYFTLDQLEEALRRVAAEQRE